MATKISKEFEKRLKAIGINAKSEEDAREALLKVLTNNGCDGLEDEDFDYILSIAEALQDEGGETQETNEPTPEEEANAIAEEVRDEQEEEQDEEPEVEEQSGDEFDDMDRTALKKYIKANGLEITVMKSWTDDRIRDEIRKLDTAEDDADLKGVEVAADAKGNQKVVPTKKKDEKKAVAEKPAKQEKKVVEKPAKKDAEKPAKKAVEKPAKEKKASKRGTKLNPMNDIDDQKEVLNALKKKFPEDKYDYAWLAMSGVTLKYKGSNAKKGVLTIENMSKDEEGNITANVWFLCYRNKKEAIEEYLDDITVAWDGTPGKKHISLDEIIEVFDNIRDTVEVSMQKSDKKLGENRAKMEENIKGGNKRTKGKK